MRALVCGISGQDGAYLATSLLKKGYSVVGTSRDASAADFSNLRKLGIFEHVELVSMAPTDFKSTMLVLSNTTPDEIYFLSGQSSVGLSFAQPMETLESITLGTLNMLEALRFFGGKTRFYHASSSECFGDLGGGPANELTPFRPKSPYAVAKASAHWMVRNYRESYGLFAANGILFNHESPLRAERYVTQKIALAVARIEAGSKEKLELGRLDIVRDWGWAPEYVEAMWRILQHEQAEDFIVATGHPTSLQIFAQQCFAHANLDWRDHIIIDENLFRPSDIAWSSGDAGKATRKLGWTATVRAEGVAQSLVETNRLALRGGD